jgi:hypothetical protein
MSMWLRLGGALLITLLVMAALEYFGVSSILGGRVGDDAQHDLESRLRELFWFGVFAFVMTMSVVAAVRRWSGHLRRAMTVAPLKRRNVA